MSTVPTPYDLPLVDSQLNLTDQEYTKNRKSWESVLKEFEERLQHVSSEGAQASLDRHRSRGQLLRAYPFIPACLFYSLQERQSKASKVEHADWLCASETARDRVALLLDQGSPFLELCPFAGFQNLNSTPCANLISGNGSVRQEKKKYLVWKFGR